MYLKIIQKIHISIYFLLPKLTMKIIINLIFLLLFVTFITKINYENYY